MVTRRFKKVSVYDALASTSGLDFSPPIVHLKNYTLREEQDGVTNAPDSPEVAHDLALAVGREGNPINKSPYKEKDASFNGKSPKDVVNVSSYPKQLDDMHMESIPKPDGKDIAKCKTAHEKYPSWPVPPDAQSAAVPNNRSHSWTSQTDYPKEKVGYSRPKKAYQYKISTNQLQPVLERTSDIQIKHLQEPQPQVDINARGIDSKPQYPACSSSAKDCNGKQFDFEGFHTPCMPQCYDDKDFKSICQPDRDSSSSPSTLKASSDISTSDSNGFLSRPEDVPQSPAQFSTPLSNWSQQSVDDTNSESSHDTPFMDRLRRENSWQVPPPPPVAPVPPPSPQAQQADQQQDRNDYDVSSENGTWMGSMESSSHGRGNAKWQGSYSDLSTLSTQLSNRSSLFDSGHSTMPESGRLSPQSSCDSTAPSVFSDGPTRSQVVARHGVYREIVAHSARVQQPERYGSESILYYATGQSCRSGSDSNNDVAEVETQKPDIVTNDKLINNNKHAANSNVRELKIPKKSDDDVFTNQTFLNKSCIGVVSESSKNLKEVGMEKKFDDSGYRSHLNSNRTTNGFKGSTNNIDEVDSQKKSDATVFRSHSTSGKLPYIKTDTQKKSEDTVFRSQASLTFSPPPSMSSVNDVVQQFENASSKGILQQDSRRSSRSISSDDARAKALEKDTPDSGVGTYSCVSPKKEPAKPTSLDKTPPVSHNTLQPPNLNQTFPKYKSGQDGIKSKSMDETTRKLIYPDQNKRERVSNPECKTDIKFIQKNAVMFYYWKYAEAEMQQRAEAEMRASQRKNENKSAPYENKLKMPPPKLSLPIPHPNRPWPSRSTSQTSSKGELTPKCCESALQNNHSKSVPNLVLLKNQTAELTTSPPNLKPGLKPRDHNYHNHVLKKGSPLAKDEIISWDQLPQVLEKNKEAAEKATAPADSKESQEETSGVASGMHYLKAHKSPRKVQLKEVHHSNETASVRVITPEGVTLLQATQERPPKRRPAPPPPPKQAPRRPPPPPPPASPPCPSHAQVVVQLDTNSQSDDEPPLPPPPPPGDYGVKNDEALPPPPPSQPDSKDAPSLIYPKNSYMSYRSEKKLGRHGFDGKYRRSFQSLTSSVDLSNVEDSFDERNGGVSPHSFEEIHDIRKHGTTVIFHSNDLRQSENHQRSNSQDSCSAARANHNVNHISNSNVHTSENIPFGNQKQNTEHPKKSVPYQAPSPDKIVCDVHNSSAERYQKSNFTKGKGLNSNVSVDDNIMISKPIEDGQPPLDNSTLAEEKLVNVENETVDHNQNSVKSNQLDNSDSKLVNGNDTRNQMNNVTHATYMPGFNRKTPKTEEERRCEQLSRDFIHLCKDISLEDLFVPTTHHKTMCEYLAGLLNIQIEKSEIQSCETPHAVENRVNGDDNLSHGDKVVSDACNENSCEVNDNQNLANIARLEKKKEDLIASIEKKVDLLKREQTNIRDEIQKNELLGQKIVLRLQELAKPNEVEKFILHVEEIEKIISLLLSLSGRLAKAENLLKNFNSDNSEEKKTLEAKRDKLKNQHADAYRLKESIDRRNNQVTMFLHKYLNDDEYAEYDHFIKMKTKLIVDIRDVDEKIGIGEEQLSALNVVVDFWKSGDAHEK